MRNRPGGAGSSRHSGTRIEALSGFDGLEEVAGRLHPVAIGLFRLQGRPGKTAACPVALVVFEEGAQAAIPEFHDAAGSLFPEFGDQQVAVLRRTFNFERKHLPYCPRGDAEILLV